MCKQCWRDSSFKGSKLFIDVTTCSIIQQLDLNVICFDIQTFAIAINPHRLFITFKDRLMAT